MLKKENCPICNSRSFKAIGKPAEINEIFSYNKELIKEISIVRCKSCSFVYLYPNIYFTEKLLSEMYNVNYWDNNAIKDKDFKNMDDKIQIMNEVIKLYNGSMKGKKILDIGCGMGEFLKVASDLGMDPLGMDIDKTTTDYIFNTYGYNTKTAWLEEDTFEENTFDFIVLSHVVEHLQNPVEFVKRIHKFLKPGGIFIMATPNVDSLLNIIYGICKQIKHKTKDSFYIIPLVSPYHINGFNKKTARTLNETCKLEVLYNEAQSTLTWEETKHTYLIKLIKIIGNLFNKGEQLVTISRKYN